MHAAERLHVRSGTREGGAGGNPQFSAERLLCSISQPRFFCAAMSHVSDLIFHFSGQNQDMF